MIETYDNQIMITYKYRIYPNKTQEKLLWDHLAVCKGAYNIGLSYCIDRYSSNKTKTSRFDLNYYLSDLKKNDEDRKYLNIVHSQVLQNVSDRIMKSYNMFFKKVCKFPKFKNMKNYNSFTYPQSGFKIREDGKKIKLSGIGEINIVYHRSIIGKIKTCTVKHNNYNQWFVCISVIQSEEEFYKKPKESNYVVGIDLGLEKLMTLSNGIIINHPHFYKKELKNIKKRQKTLSKKKLGSKNREKSRLRLAKAHLKIYNRRKDFLFKLSHFLVNHYQVIGLEDINPQFMIKNHHLAQSITDASWSMLKSVIEYESNKHQTIVGFVDPKYTSQIRSSCGEIVKKDLSVRTHKCPKCGLVMDRDLNAAINILNRIPENFKNDKIIQIPMECRKFTLMETGPLLISYIDKQAKSLK